MRNPFDEKYKTGIVAAIFSLIALPLAAQVVNFNFSVPLLNEPCGGTKNAVQLIHREFVYPIEDIKQETDGLVAISFGIDKQGNVIHLKIDSATTEAMKAEALRMFKLLRWPPDARRIIMDKPTEHYYLDFRRKDWVKVYKRRKYMTPEYPFEPIDSIYTLYAPLQLDVQPEPVYSKGTYDSYLHYISQKLMYPENAKRLGLSGEVVVEWVVESSGRVSNVYVSKGLQGGCNEEAIRVIKSLGWIPGKKGENYVRTKMAAAIGFGVPSRGITDISSQGQSGGGN
jgi:TonB family protein